MTAPRDVLVWAQQVVKRRLPAHQLLEIAPDATLDEAQDAFHRIARAAHPDLHRTTLSADELELVTAAYARAAAAYQELRSQRAAARIRSVRESEPGSGPLPPAPPPAPPPPTTPPRVGPVGEGAPVNLAQAMNSKALLYYRKAELALRRGDLSGAVLQLRLAIASDPRSAFLRSALGEVEAALREPT
jgi:tetratricopeptide (TPR) repeat protein